MLPGVTFILGGAASGKSEFAEELVKSSGLPMVYIATSQVLDAEMETKRARHAARRGPGWTLIEASADTEAALAGLPQGSAALLDCATMWLANRMEQGADLEAATAALIAAIDACPARLVIVSNETGQGIVPENALARRFREAQGRLNIRLAARADLAVQVVAGLPLVLKGRLP